MRAGPPTGLDLLEHAAEQLRNQLGVDTLSVSRLGRSGRDLGTLVNAGVLGPGEVRQPADERYPLDAFPAAAALVAHRRPYLFGSDTPADPASATLEIQLQKTSQAAAPLIVRDEVWGELWVASTAEGLPLQPAEKALICWAARRFGTLIQEMVGDGVDLAAAADPVRATDRYEVWIKGHVNATFAALIPAAARRLEHHTVFEAGLEPRDLYRLLSRLNELSLEIVAVGPSVTCAAEPYLTARRRGRGSDTYQIRVAGHLPAEQLRNFTDCTVSHQDGDSVITARLDRIGLARVLHRLQRLRARLLSLHRTS
jgi:hypothetical protein